MSGALWPRRMIRLGLLGVAAITVLVPGVLLVRDTAGHDWYAARRLTVAEAMLAVGFSKYTTVVYRTEYGDTWKLSRGVLAEFESPAQARRHILATIGDGVMLGAGAGGTVFCLMLIGAAGHGWQGRTGTALEPAVYPWRHPSASGEARRIADWVRPGLRARVAPLAVSPAELERLLVLLGHGRRPGFVDLPGPDGEEPAEDAGGLPECTETPSLPPAENGGPGSDSAVPANPAPADPRNRPNAAKADKRTGDRAVARKRRRAGRWI